MGGLKSEVSTVIIFLLMGAVLLVESMYCFFIVPLIAVDNVSVLTAFKQSAHFVREHFWKVLLTYFAFSVLTMATEPHAQHTLWLRDHYLLIILDLAVLLLWLPWLLNLVILVVRDLQLRHSMN